MSTKFDKRFFRPFGIRLNDSNHKATGQRVYDHLKYIFSSSHLHVQSMKENFAIQSLMEYNSKTIPWQEMWLKDKNEILPHLPVRVKVTRIWRPQLSACIWQTLSYVCPSLPQIDWGDATHSDFTGHWQAA